MGRVKAFDLTPKVQATVIKKLIADNEDDGDNVLEIIYYIDDEKLGIYGEMKIEAGYEEPEERDAAYDKTDRALVVNTYNDMLSDSKFPLHLESIEA